jgi:beta-phosphoglucomutase
MTSTMKIESVLFDMDGTIIRSITVWDKIIASFVGNQQIPLFLNLRANAQAKGINGTCAALRELTDVHGTDAEIMHRYEQRAEEYLHHATIDFIDGFQDFHNHLIEQKISMSLVTNAPNYALNVLRKKLNLELFFGQHIYNSCTVNNRFKPDPAVLLHALEKLKVEAKNCIIFEDSHEGVLAAKRAGIFCVGVNSGQNLNDIAQTDRIITDYTDLTLEKLASYHQVSYPRTRFSDAADI